MTEIEIEMFNHISPEEFKMSDNEVLSMAFTLSQSCIAPYEFLPKEHQEVRRDDAVRVLSTAIALLES